MAMGMGFRVPWVMSTSSGPLGADRPRPLLGLGRRAPASSQCRRSGGQSDMREQRRAARIALQS